MIFIYIFILLAAFVGVKQQAAGDAALSRIQTTAIKGIFVMLVFASHVSAYLDLSMDTSPLTSSYVWFRAYLGQMIVVGFLFYSGYGIRCSIDRKGLNYVRSIPRNRMFPTFLHCIPFVLLYFLVSILVGKSYQLKTIIGAFFLWSDLGNSNWYIFAILYLYGATYISFMLFRKKSSAIFCCTLLTIAYCLAIKQMKQDWWYSTVLVYCFGLLIPDLRSIQKSSVRDCISVWLGRLILYCFLFWLLSGAKTGLPLWVRENLRAIALGLIILVLSERVHIGNPVLNWLGTHVFECYMVHRLPMIIFSQLCDLRFNRTCFIILCAVSTVVLAEIASRLLRKVDKLMFRENSLPA